eukprot:CAMPEP_0172646268 /NCGR_PEP_ID=MMETSP1068-20121228/240153_1 /TAXON_ID=35684 /ORGANISM="Pseudopedinella elastica, Strain CCMP716" /LENGTH=263 /DNA_ID=CAMNT_0013460523 /DNA_START=331 /DNA_END=1119 /DNA_ORIENTATION=+
MRSGLGSIAKACRFGNEAHRAQRCVWLWGDTAAVARLCSLTLPTWSTSKKKRTALGDATTLGDVKALASGQAYSKSPSTAFGAFVQKRVDKVHEDYRKIAKKLDAILGTHADATGPVETEMNSYNSGRVSGFVVGTFGEVSMQLRDPADLVACELNADHLALFDGAMNESKQILTQQIHRSIGLAVLRGWANCFSADAVALSKAHGSRVLTHARQLRTTPRHTGTPIFTRPAAGWPPSNLPSLEELSVGILGSSFAGLKSNLP